MPTADHEPRVLDYATPHARASRRLPAWVFLIGAFVLTATGLVVTPPYYGSGIMRANPLAIIPAIGVWLLLLTYIARRITSEANWPCFGLSIAIAGAWIAAILMPIQVRIWIYDPGAPQSRWRSELMAPLWIAVGGMILYIVGRLNALRSAGPKAQPPSPQS